MKTTWNQSPLCEWPMWGGLLVTAIGLSVHVVAASITMVTIDSNGTSLDYERHYEAAERIRRQRHSLDCFAATANLADIHGVPWYLAFFFSERSVRVDDSTFK